MSKKTLEDRLAAIAIEAEAGEEDQTVEPIPSHVKVMRGKPRSKVLQVRLNPDEYAAIERIAERRGLPPSTVSREALLRLVADDDAEGEPLVAIAVLADRLKALTSKIAVSSNSRPADDPVGDWRQVMDQQSTRASGKSQSRTVGPVDPERHECATVTAAVWAMLDGETTEEARAWLREQVQTCPTCFRRYLKAEGIKHRLSKIHDDAPGNLGNNILLEIARTEPRL